MENKINGIHHITAIATDAKANYHFYTHILGLRLVKKTVNFDDPFTYHFYYGDKTGTPGSILTFFPWEGISNGRRGARQVTEIGYSVPEDSFGFWMERFEKNNILYNKPAEKFGEPYLTFLDPDGLKMELVVPKKKDYRQPWTTEEVKSENATRGFHNITITTNKMEPTAEILTEVFGFRFSEQHINRTRFIIDTLDNAAIVDLVEIPGEPSGQVAGGSVHHVAFRVPNEEVQMYFREKIEGLGFNITKQIDRNYFYSLYFREPGGVLFEIATDTPGFLIDEPVEELGKSLKLPEIYEVKRKEIESKLAKL